MKYNVYYTYQGELYNAGQYNSKTEARKAADELVADAWRGVRIIPVGTPATIAERRSNN